MKLIRSWHIFCLFETVLSFSSGWPGNHYIAQAALELMEIPQLWWKCYDDWHEPSQLVVVMYLRHWRHRMDLCKRTQASVISKDLSQVTGQERVTVFNWKPVNHTFYSMCVLHTLLCACMHRNARVRSCGNQCFSFQHGGPRNQCQMVRRRGSTLTHWPILLASVVCV